MVHKWLFYIHVSIAYLIALFTIISLFVEVKIRVSGKSAAASGVLNRFLLTTIRWSSYGLLVLFLIGGYMGGPYFKLGFAGHSGWIYMKVILFIILLGWMGGFGTRSLKKRQELLQQNPMDENAFRIISRKITIFLVGQLFLVAGIFFLAYGKPF